MLRRNFLRVCSSASSAAPAAASAQPPQQQQQFLHNTEPIPVEAGATPTHFDFAARYEELRADKNTNGNNALASESYTALMSNLKQYDQLLRKYSVKQTELERARKAARMCGLEWTKQGNKKADAAAAAAAAAASAAEQQKEDFFFDQNDDPPTVVVTASSYAAKWTDTQFDAIIVVGSLLSAALSVLSVFLFYPLIYNIVMGGRKQIECPISCKCTLYHFPQEVTTAQTLRRITLETETGVLGRIGLRLKNCVAACNVHLWNELTLEEFSLGDPPTWLQKADGGLRLEPPRLDSSDGGAGIIDPNPKYKGCYVRLFSRRGLLVQQFACNYEKCTKGFKFQGSNNNANLNGNNATSNNINNNNENSNVAVENGRNQNASVVQRQGVVERTGENEFSLHQEQGQNEQEMRPVVVSQGTTRSKYYTPPLLDDVDVEIPASDEDDLL